MKKYIYILIAVMTAILVSSCGTTGKVSNITNNPFEGWGTGSANDDYEAFNIAYAKAKEMLMTKYESNVTSETKITYNQVNNGANGHDNSQVKHETVTFSDGTVRDVVVYKTEPLKSRERGNFRFGYRVFVRVDPTNITTL